MTSNEDVLRELNSLEIIFENGQRIGRFICPKVFIIESHIEINEHQDIVKKAILEWMKQHPLLNSYIIERDSKLFFKFNLDIIDDSLKNVIFLNFSDTYCDNVNCWRSLHEFELSNKFNSSYELLWRIYFIKLSDIKYCILLNLNHAISDGKNSYAIIQELLGIIEDLYDSKSIIENKDKQYELDYPCDPRFIQVPADFNQITNEKKVITDIIIPKYLKEVNLDFLKKDSFLTHDKINTNFGRIEYFQIQSKIYLKFLEKSKEMSVKLTSCFETVIALAWYKTIRKYSNDDVNSVNVKYSVTINTRQFLEQKLDIKTMGSWVAYHLSNLELTNQIKKQEFWNIARSKSQELDNFLREKSFFNEERLLENHKFYFNLENNLLIRDLLSYYSITNIGKLTGHQQDAKGKITINQYYSSTSFAKNEIYNAAYHSICTIDDTIYCSITYNTYYLKHEVVLDWISLIQETIKEIID